MVARARSSSAYDERLPPPMLLLELGSVRLPRVALFLGALKTGFSDAQWPLRVLVGSKQALLAPEQQTPLRCLQPTDHRQSSSSPDVDFQREEQGAER